MVACSFRQAAQGPNGHTVARGHELVSVNGIDVLQGGFNYDRTMETITAALAARPVTFEFALALAAEGCIDARAAT